MRVEPLPIYTVGSIERTAQKMNTIGETITEILQAVEKIRG